MKWRRIRTGFLMTIRMLARRRIVLILVAAIPVIFLSVVDLTSPDTILPFQLGSLSTTTYLQVGQRELSTVFFAVASAGFLVSYIALNLIQRNRRVNRRLVICGYRPVEIVAANFLSVTVLITVIAAYVALLTHLFIPIERALEFTLGLMLIGFVYGTYGLVVGSLINGELEGILLLLLLVNIDAGWLQNPLFYAGAENQEFIHFLPAFYPAQVSVIAAFSDHDILSPVIRSFGYGGLFLLLAMFIFFYRMRLTR